MVLYGILNFFQLCEIHAQAFLAMLAVKLHIDKFGLLHHLAFEDDSLTKCAMTHLVAGLELLDCGLRGRRRCRRCAAP